MAKGGNEEEIQGRIGIPGMDKPSKEGRLNIITMSQITILAHGANFNEPATKAQVKNSTSQETSTPDIVKCWLSPRAVRYYFCTPS